jgi:hypothetical protein
LLFKDNDRSLLGQPLWALLAERCICGQIVGQLSILGDVLQYNKVDIKSPSDLHAWARD